MPAIFLVEWGMWGVNM